MSTGTWEQHLHSRDNPVLEGQWGDTPWAFYDYDLVLPPELPIKTLRTGMCVPVCSLNPDNPQVMLTVNIERGGLEIPGGHRERLKNGEVESGYRAAVRERGEETGLHTETNRLIPYGYIEARNTPSPDFPLLTYMQFFGAYTPEYPGRITDPEVDGAGIFTLDALYRMAERGLIKTTELGLACLGIRAVFRHYGVPDDRVRMP